MRKDLAGLLILVLMLTACGANEKADSSAAAENIVTPASRIGSMSEPQRNAVFIRAIRDAGMSCQHVKSSTPAGEHKGMPVWSVRCQDDGEWTIVIGPGDAAQIVNAAEAKLVDSPKSEEAR